MFAPLSEYIEMKLEEAFCKEYRVMSSCDRPTHEWEDYKKAYADWAVERFLQNDSAPPIHPKRNRHWRSDDVRNINGEVDNGTT